MIHQNTTYSQILSFIRELYPNLDEVNLHEPYFDSSEKKYLLECIDSGFVSSVGQMVHKIENVIQDYTGSKNAIMTVNGTSALHASLVIKGVSSSDEVITQPMTFIATCNAISYCGAKPIFIDVDKKTLGLSHESLKEFLTKQTTIKHNQCINNKTGKVIRACVCMHTFGMPSEIKKIKQICNENHISLIEDCAESLGSFYNGIHTGNFGDIGILSFNGNKIVTSGGGGCILTNDDDIAQRARHIVSTAKINHTWEYDHDEIGFNYRMPNLNAALLLGQMEKIGYFLSQKRKLASLYREFFRGVNHIDFFDEYNNANSNFWLNTIIFESIEDRNLFLNESNKLQIKTRPVWKLMSNLEMYKNSEKWNLKNAHYLENRIVNLPSSAIYQ